MKKSVIRVSNVVGYSPPGQEKKYVSRLLVDAESVGSKNLVLNHFTLFPGEKTYSGSHPSPFEEVYYILRGKGILTLDGVNGERHEMNSDTVAYIASEREHQIENVGDEPLEMITMMPFQPKKGANSLYDARKEEWGTSFKEITTNDINTTAKEASVSQNKSKENIKATT